LTLFEDVYTSSDYEQAPSLSSRQLTRLILVCILLLILLRILIIIIVKDLHLRGTTPSRSWLCKLPE
jgi:hypothetical protein